MKKYDIDQYVKGKVGKASTPYSEGDWKAMEAMLDEDSKGVFFFFRKYAVLLLLFTLGGATFYMFSDGDSDENELTTNSVKRKGVNLENTEEIVSENSTELDSKINETTEVEEVVKVEQTIDKKTSNSIVRVADEIAFSTEMPTNKVPSVGTESPEVELPLKVQTPKFQVVSSSTVKSSFSDMEVLMLKSKSINDIEYSISDLQGSKRKYLELNPTWQWTISPYIQRTILLDNEAYRMDIQWANEVPLATWGAGVSASAHYKRFVFSVGAGYSKSESMADYNQTTFTNRYDTSYILNKRNFSTTKSGKDLALVKEVIGVTMDSFTSVYCEGCRSKIEYLDIPFSMQYVFGNKRIRPYGEIGSVVSFPIKTSGYFNRNFVSRDGTLIDNNNQARANTLVRVSAAVGTHVSVTSRWDFYTQMGYRTGMNSIFKGQSQNSSDVLWKAGLSLRL